MDRYATTTKCPKIESDPKLRHHGAELATARYREAGFLTLRVLVALADEAAKHKGKEKDDALNKLESVGHIPFMQSCKDLFVELVPSIYSISKR